METKTLCFEQYIKILNDSHYPASEITGRGEGDECNMTGRCPFLKNIHNLLKKKDLHFNTLYRHYKITKFPENTKESYSLLFLNKQP